MTPARTGFGRLRSSPAMLGVFALVCVLAGSYGRTWLSALSEPEPPANLRPEIARLVHDEVDALEPGQVASYLDQLEARARRRGQVTALEIEPGLTAIARHSPANAEERREEFLARMMRVQSSLAKTAAND